MNRHTSRGTEEHRKRAATQGSRTNSRSRRLVAVAVLLLVPAASLAAQAAGSAHATNAAWTRISGPTQAGIQLGLARTADHVLHVVWNRGTPSTTILETRLSPAGRALGTSTVASGFGGNGGLALLVMPDGTLRLFAAGSVTSSSSDGGINTYTASAGGRSWGLQSGTFWGGAVAQASALIGATLTKDGQPVTAWRGTAAEGLPPSSIPQNAFVPDELATHLATDAGSGAVVLAGITGGGNGGVFVRQILPSLGPAVVLPDSSYNNDWIDGLSSRIGAPGTFVAFADTKAVRLRRYGGATKTLANGRFESATVCAGPEGRLWVAWGDDTNDVFATRSNRAVTAFEPVQKLALPQGTTNGLRYKQCEGSAGPVDLFVDVNDRASQPGFWHTQLLAQLALRASVARGEVTLSLRDAGDPVPGATIAMAGRHLKTDAKGRATVRLGAGSYTATATADGYAPATAHIKV